MGLVRGYEVRVDEMHGMRERTLHTALFDFTPCAASFFQLALCTRFSTKTNFGFRPLQLFFFMQRYLFSSFQVPKQDLPAQTFYNHSSFRRTRMAHAVRNTRIFTLLQGKMSRPYRHPHYNAHASSSRGARHRTWVRAQDQTQTDTGYQGYERG